MGNLQDIWILSDSGAVLFNRVFNKTVDEQMFGALMSALNTFAEELTKGGLSNFELNDKRFTIVKSNRLIFIATSDTNVKDKKIIEELKAIARMFYAQYFLILKDWDGKITHFLDFGRDIEDSLLMNVDKFHEAFL